MIETLPGLTIAAHFFVSLVTTALVYRHVLRICIEKDITDKPCSRKLQQAPVSVLGGVAVFFGILVALVADGIVSGISGLYPVACIMTLMLCVGVTDDILGLTPVSRIAVEVAAVLALIYTTGCSIGDFHGLWGIGQLPGWLAVCLTVFAGVGIINSVNLIDGVNGLCSGYCIFACTAFGVYSLFSGETQTAVLAFVCIGALLPFLCHNVFGQTSKMFIGNGGTLLMGTVMVYFVISCIHGAEILSVIPFTLAVLSIPVFDTVRVMGVRMVKGRSPFSPDKGHLHHLLFSIHFSHDPDGNSVGCNGHGSVVGLRIVRCLGGRAALHCCGTRFLFHFRDLRTRRAYTDTPAKTFRCPLPPGRLDTLRAFKVVGKNQGDYGQVRATCVRFMGIENNAESKILNVK